MYFHDIVGCSTSSDTDFIQMTLKSECGFTCLFFYLLCSTKYSIWQRQFKKSLTVEESIQVSTVSQVLLRHMVLVNPSLQLYTRGMLQPSHPVQRLQYGVTSSGPSHCSSHLPTPQEALLSLQTLGDTAAEIGE